MSYTLYATADDLLRTFGAPYVAELVDPSEHGLVDDVLLRAAVTADDADGALEVDASDEAYAAAQQSVVIILDALRVASGEMDTYIRQRYALPLSDVGVADAALLRSHCLYIARYHLADSADRESESIRNRYKDAVAWPKDIASGKALLDTALPESADARVANRAVVRPGRSAFDWGTYP